MGAILLNVATFELGKYVCIGNYDILIFFEIFDSISNKVQQTESFSIVLNFSRKGYVAKIGGFRSGQLGVLFSTMIFDQPQPLAIQKFSLSLSLFT